MGVGERGGSCHEVMIVNFRFHESGNKTFTSVKFTKVTEKKSDHSAVKFSYLSGSHQSFPVHKVILCRLVTSNCGHFDATAHSSRLHLLASKVL